MPRYEALLLQATVATTYKTTGMLTAGATLARRLAVYDIEFGQTGPLNSSTDCQMEWDVTRFSVSAAAAGTSFVPNPLDPADTASPTGIYLNNLTAEPTYTTASIGTGLSVKHWAINQRGSYRWRA